MRGHLCDMERLDSIVRQNNLILIEDCAHTMGAAWNGRKSGNFGLAGCFSTQTYKHLNSGEGGLLTSDDPEFMARAIIMSGSYMLYERHGADAEASVGAEGAGYRYPEDERPGPGKGALPRGERVGTGSDEHPAH